MELARPRHVRWGVHPGQGRAVGQSARSGAADFLRRLIGRGGPGSARFSDTYLTWGEPPAAVGKKVEWIAGLAAEYGRKLTYGLRIHVITRDTADEAWAVADRLLAGIDPADIERMQANLRRSESEGQRRMAELHRGGTDSLEIAPNLWAGVGLVRGGAGTALVGSHEEVAARIVEYSELGIGHFILSGYPHLEEAYRFADLVFPLLSLARPGNTASIRVNTGPFGETVANEHRPLLRASQS